MSSIPNKQKRDLRSYEPDNLNQNSTTMLVPTADWRFQTGHVQDRQYGPLEHMKFRVLFKEGSIYELAF